MSSTPFVLEPKGFLRLFINALGWLLGTVWVYIVLIVSFIALFKIGIVDAITKEFDTKTIFGALLSVGGAISGLFTCLAAAIGGPFMVIENFYYAFSRKTEKIIVDDQCIKFINRRKNTVREISWSDIEKIDNKKDIKKDEWDDDKKNRDKTTINLYLREEVITFHLSRYEKVDSSKFNFMMQKYWENRKIPNNKDSTKYIDSHTNKPSKSISGEKLFVDKNHYKLEPIGILKAILWAIFELIVGAGCVVIIILAIPFAIEFTDSIAAEFEAGGIIIGILMWICMIIVGSTLFLIPIGAPIIAIRGIYRAATRKIDVIYFDENGIKFHNSKRNTTKIVTWEEIDKLKQKKGEKDNPTGTILLICSGKTIEIDLFEYKNKLEEAEREILTIYKTYKTA
ncbi:MAG: hypothetical protein JW776_14660 [Candidatus Lokiarchaeota archaeon]|nr:hypothetical protein [Candidatus Lokiarchaeota archaeon]